MLCGKLWESEKAEMEMDSNRPNHTRCARLSLLYLLGDGTSRIGRRPLSMKISKKTEKILTILLGILLFGTLLFILIFGAMVATEF